MKKWVSVFMCMALLLLMVPLSLGVAAEGTLSSEEYVTKAAAELSDVVRFRGRSMAVGTAQSFDWSASGFEFVFEGSGSITANITTNSSPTLVLVVDINGEEHRVSVPNGTRDVVLASNLEQGTYTIKVYKINEAARSLSQLNSLRYQDGSILTKTPEYALNFEFLGDSITCGDQVTTTESDGYAAYASVLARAYNANWNTISVSGRGLMAGWNLETGWNLDRNSQINTLFNYTSWFRDKTTKWDFNSFTPDVVIANLGSNDLGPSTGVTIAQFTAEVKRFTGVLREKYPNAEIIWCYGLYVNRAYSQEYAAAIDELRETDTKVHFLYFPQMGGGGGSHPTREEHQNAAKMLSALIAEILGVENPMDEYIPPEEAIPEKGGYLSTTGTALPGVEEGWTRYEAENAVIYASSKVAGQENVTQDGCEDQAFFSGGKAAGGFQSNVLGEVYKPEDADFEIGNIAYVKFTVYSKYAGNTTMRIGFNGSDPNAALILKVNDEDNRQITLPNPQQGAWNLMGYVEFDVTLQAGENILYISRPIHASHLEVEGSWRNIDFIDVQNVEEAPQFEPGDVNGDNVIDSKDARLILQSAVEAIDLTPEQQVRANVNEDTDIDSKDARLVLQIAVQ